MYVGFTFFLYYYHLQQLKSLDCHVGVRRQILLLILSEFERTDFRGGGINKFVEILSIFEAKFGENI